VVFGLAVLAFLAYPPGAGAAIAAFLTGVLVLLAAIDLERGIIPTRIVVSATAIALVANLAFRSDRWSEFILAAAAIAVVFLIPNLISNSLMGMGDVRLALLLGAGLGWGAVGAVAVASLSIFPVALAMIVRDGLAARKTTLPFGPFLALGGLVIIIVPRLTGLGGS
jgi:prepilin signal peptidase PulO-like enzyme (type II secretory pathway)